jgi:hypothetical protein
VLDWHPHVGLSDSNNFVGPGMLQNYIELLQNDLQASHVITGLHKGIYLSYGMNATCRFGMQVHCTIVDNVCPATFGGVSLVRVTREDISI